MFSCKNDTRGRSHGVIYLVLCLSDRRIFFIYSICNHVKRIYHIISWNEGYHLIILSISVAVIVPVFFPEFILDGAVDDFSYGEG